MNSVDVVPGGSFLTSTIFMLGGGALAGMAVGYAMRVATRVALLVTGIVILILYGLMSSGFVVVNWDAVGNGLEDGSRTAGAWLLAMVRHLSASLVGFAGGVVLGWRLK